MTRTEKHERLVPHTINGRTRMITETYTVQAPKPPRDWDGVVLRGATMAASALVAASVVWSTTCIGGLLTVTVNITVAFIAASVFDLGWITCMAIEWLARYDRARARLPRNAGNTALVVAMLAVAADGWINGSPVAGLVGAAVSGLAKGVWSVLIAHTARPLDSRTRQWVEQEMAEATALLALAEIRRQVARTIDTADAVQAAIDAPNAANTPTDTAVRAVRHAANTMPGATVEDISDQLDHAGISVSAKTVRTVLANSDEQPNSRSETVVRLVPDANERIVDTVRQLVRDGVHDLKTVLAVVRSVHGENTSRDTVRITLGRALDQSA